MTALSAQTALEDAIALARIYDDREIRARVRGEGLRLASLLSGLIRASRLYAADNSALDGPARETEEALGASLGILGSVHLGGVEEHLYVNDVRLRVRPQEQGSVDSLLAELGRHDVGGILFHAALPADSLKKLARALAGPSGEPPGARAALSSRLEGVKDVQLTGRSRYRVSSEAPPTAHESWRELLERSAAAALGAAESLAAGRIPSPIPVRRAIVGLLERLREDSSLAALPPLPAASGGVARRHVLGVTFLALRLGQALGLDDGALSDLGVAAMLHDVGYASGGTRDSHSVLGLRLLLRQHGFHDAKIRRLLTVLEHHEPWRETESPSLFARIVKIADDYDILTTSRPGHPGLPPPLAQGSLWAARGKVYDPDLLALLVRVLGAYPPGSLLELRDGRRVVSVSGGRDRERFAWPIVRVVDGGEEVDLFEQKDTLKPRRVLNPATVGVDVAPVLDRAFGLESGEL